MNVSGNKKIAFIGVIILIVVSILKGASHVNTSYASDDLWSIRSIDTMKVSRDMARANVTDATIEKEITLIKSLGANYVALGTPYDNEFIPYLKRWVTIARSHGLKIWYRGTFSGYEGWFGYPKQMTPDELLERTSQFIKTNKDLFKDDDIFDPCPECENAGHWKQPLADDAYNEFMQKKNDVLRDSFQDIGVYVIYNLNSVIGGRAKDVLKKETFDYLDNVIALDHYATPAENYGEYIKYFAENFNTDVVFSEIGAPIPDIHGKMTEEAQAEFMRQAFSQLYRNKKQVTGLNYWVLSGGTTALYNANYTPRKVVDVIKDYYISGVIRGNATDELNNPVEGVKVATADGFNVTYSDRHGNYQLNVPAGKTQIQIGDQTYVVQTEDFDVSHGEQLSQDFTLEPTSKNFFYSLRLQINTDFASLWNKLTDR